MRGVTSTLILVVVLAGLGAYIYFVDSKRPAAGPDGSVAAAKEKVFTVEGDQVNELRVTSKGQSSLLRKTDGGWKLVEPAPFDADPPEVIGMANALGNVEVVRVVDENATNLEQFGLANPSVIVEYKADGGAAGKLKLGNKNATQGEIYALKNDDQKRVFLVSSFQETTFNRTPYDLRDKKILKFDRDKADSLVLVKGPASLELTRSGTDWAVAKPVASRSDYSAIEGFLTRLASANMSKMIEEHATDFAKYGLDQPSMTVTIGAGSAKTILQVGNTENGETYARDAARPVVFTLDSTLQGDLNKNFDDYRKKELFEFRPFYVAKLRAVLDSPGGPKTYEFEKTKGAQPTDPDVWRVTRVGGASHNADPAAMDDLLNKLVTIKADSFVDGKTRAGLDKPALVVSASFDDGKFERVRFGQVGEESYGKRDSEGVVAKIEHMSMRAALQAFDAVVTPKAEEKK